MRLKWLLDFIILQKKLSKMNFHILPKNFELALRYFWGYEIHENTEIGKDLQLPYNGLGV